MSKLHVLCSIVLLSTISFAQASAPSFDPGGIIFTKLDVPGATATIPTGINDSGTILGFFENSSSAFHGFVADEKGIVIGTIDFPGATQTEPSGTNERGDIVGSYANDDGVFHGFILRDGNFTTSDVPGAMATFPLDINDGGVIAGFYEDAQLFDHGYTLDGTRFHTIDDPAQGNLPSTEVFAITSSGDILGDFNPDPFGIFHGAFLLRRGEFVPFTFPAATQGIFALGLSNSDDVTGSFIGDEFVQHGFLEHEGKVISFDFPGALATAPQQMNSSRHIVGVYADQAVNTRGFLITFDAEGSTNTAVAPASSILRTAAPTGQTVCGLGQATTHNTIRSGQKMICHQ